MKRSFINVDSLIGKEVEKFFVIVEFYRDERTGAVSEALILLRNGSSLAFGCGGDGEVLITSVVSEIVGTDEISLVRRELEGVNGRISSIERGGGRLSLHVGDEYVQIINSDDEVVISVNNERVEATRRGHFVNRGSEGNSEGVTWSFAKGSCRKNINP